MATMSRTPKLPSTSFVAAIVRSAGLAARSIGAGTWSRVGSALIVRISPSTRPLSASTRPPTDSASPVTWPPGPTDTSEPRLTTDPSTVPRTMTGPWATAVPLCVVPAGTVRVPFVTLSTVGSPAICSPFVSRSSARFRSPVPSDCPQRADGISVTRRARRGRRCARILRPARRRSREPSERQHGPERGTEEAEHEHRDAERPRGLECRHGRLAEDRYDDVARGAEDERLETVREEPGREHH